MDSGDCDRHVVEDCFGHLILYNDGSIFRSQEIEFKTPLLHHEEELVHKDFLFNQQHNLHLRLYKPKTNSKKLPILFHFHGGGFCFGSFTYPHHHNICVRLATELEAFVIEPDHRLAPEHRLPAALDDATSALKWLRDKAMHDDDDDEDMGTWLDGADFDRVFVLGYSSGGNLAHHMAVRFSGCGAAEVAPVRVRGYVLLSPFFGGLERTRCEKDRPFERFWNLEMYDRFWRLSVPVGSSQDHPMVNPFGPCSRSLAEVALDPMLVMVGADEILRDRVENYATKLREIGKNIEYIELEGEQHGYFIDHPPSPTADRVMAIVKIFMSDK